MTMRQDFAGPPCECPQFAQPRIRERHREYLVNHDYACLQIRRAGRSMDVYYGRAAK